MAERSLAGHRRSSRGVRNLVLSAVVLGAVSLLTARAQAAGTLTDLGSLQSGCGSTAVAINNRGQVAGTSCGEPFRWTAANGMEGLGFLSSANPYGVAAAMNAKGEVTGWSDDQTGGGFPNVFLWSPSKGMRNLTPQDTYPGALGQAINAAGQVAYTQPHPDSTSEADIWSPGKGTRTVGELGGTVVEIGIGTPPYTLFPCCISAAALNDHGDATGLAETWIAQNIYTHAYLSTPSTGMQDLGTLPGDVNSAGVAVNDHQDVAGNSENADDVLHAFVWTPSAGMQELTLPGAASSDAVDINNKGEVIGYAQLASGTTEAFLWVPGHGLKDLGAGKAVAINQSGTVVVAGTDGNAYRWTTAGGLSEIGPGTPTAINDHGEITGDGANGDAFLWSAANGTRDGRAGS
jgi:probable HAF family extracellular repeat protein